MFTQTRLVPAFQVSMGLQMPAGSGAKVEEERGKIWPLDTRRFRMKIETRGRILPNVERSGRGTLVFQIRGEVN